MIVAPEELRSEIEDALSAEARESIVGWASAEAHATPGELLAIARPHLERARVARVGAALERWREERGKHGRASAGWAETLYRRMGARMPPGFTAMLRSRAETSGGSCPLDGTELEPGGGADLAVQHTLAHGGVVATVPRGQLADAEGIGALLRF